MGLFSGLEISLIDEGSITIILQNVVFEVLNIPEHAQEVRIRKMYTAQEEGSWCKVCCDVSPDRSLGDDAVRPACRLECSKPGPDLE
jgi:hypothetical protein